MKEMTSYGWIGNDAGVKARVRKNAHATKLAKVIKEYLGNKNPSVEVKQKNLVEYDGRIIYILCISGTGRQWMPYCSVVKLLKEKPDLNFCLLLGQDLGNDTENLKGQIWFFEKDAASEIFYKDETERLKNNGITYTLPIKEVDEKKAQKFSGKEGLEKALGKLIL